MIGNNFGDDFENNITKGYCPKVIWVGRLVFFGYQGKEGCVEC